MDINQQKKILAILENNQKYSELKERLKQYPFEIIETAKGYAAERVNRAQGDASKFEKILAEYTKAPDITKQRLYFETMSELLPKIPEKWIIEQGGADGGILMKLDLEDNENEWGIKMDTYNNNIIDSEGEGHGGGLILLLIIVENIKN